MVTVKGKLKQVYEITNPTPTIITQRFLIEEENESCSKTFLTLFNNVDLISKCKVGDVIEVDYTQRVNEKNGVSYSNNYVNKIRKVMAENERNKFVTNLTRQDYYNLKVCVGNAIKTNLTLEDYACAHKQLNVGDNVFYSALENLVKKYRHSDMLINSEKCLTKELQMMIN